MSVARTTATAVALAVFATGGLGGCSGDSRPAQWSYIAPVIMEPNCATASCHSRATAAAGLDFSDADRGYKSLTGLWTWVSNPTTADKQTLHCGTAKTGAPVCDEYLRPLVTPYVPGESRLVNVLRARGAERMPPDRPLNEADIRLVEQWILDGASKDARQLPDAGGAVAVPSDGGTDTDGPAIDAGTGADGNSDGNSDGDGSSGDLAPDGADVGG